MKSVKREREREVSERCSSSGGDELVSDIDDVDFEFL